MAEVAALLRSPMPLCGSSPPMPAKTIVGPSSVSAAARIITSTAWPVALAWTLGCLIALAEPAGATWSDQFTAPAFDNAIRAFATFEGRLVAAGDFRQTPDGLAKHIAVWNGIEWRPLGEGLASRASALVVHDGGLIAAAAYSYPALAPVVSQWDGERWERMDAGLGPCHVAALAVHQDQLVACGDVRFTDTVWRHAAARWDGESWQPLGPRYGVVRGGAMTVHDGHLVIGGRFHWADDTTAALIVRWSGTEWDTLAIGSASDEVNALTSRAGVLYAGGRLDRFAGGAVARRSGNTWERVAPFGSGVVRTLRIQDGDLIVGGRFALDDGGIQSVVRWSETGVDSFPALRGTVLATATFGQRLVVGGGDLVALTGLEPVALLAAQWADGAWLPVGGQVSGAGLIDFQGGVVAALRAEEDALVAGGRFTFARDGRRWIPISNVALWDGSRWSPMGSEIEGAVAAFARYRGELIAAGSFSGGYVDERIENIARWDGARWRPFGGGIDGGVAALLVVGDSLVAAGWIRRAGDADVNNVALWDGESWTPIGPVYFVGVWDYPSVSALAILDGALLRAEGPSLLGWSPNVRRWNGTEWKSMDAGLDVAVAVLHWHNGELLAGGRGGLAKWDGSRWIRFGDDAPDQVHALESDGDTLYVGGRFQGAGAVESPGIVRWTGAEWQGLGSGLGPSDPYTVPARAIARFRGSLFVGGQMAIAGGNRSSRIARWGAPFAGAQAPVNMLGPGRPNPFTREVELPFSIAETQRVRVSILDLAGRRVRTVLDQVIAAGSHWAVWDGRDRNGLRVRPGVYWVFMKTATGAEGTRKVVLIP